MSSNIKTIGGLTILKIIGAIAGIVYSVFQVRYFGTSRSIEVFFAAQTILYLVQSLTQTGQLSEIFLPVYIKLKTKYNSEIAYKAFSVLLNRFTVYVSFGLFIGYYLAPYIINSFIPGFSNHDKQIAVTIFRVLLPLILLQLNNSFFNTVLNAEKIYGRTEIGGIINYIVSTVLLVTLFNKIGIWSLVWASYAGVIIQLVISIFFAINKNIKYYFVWSDSNFNHKQFFKIIFSTFSYTGSTQLLNWAMTASMSFLPQGMFALFQYVQRLFNKINSVTTQPISTVFFTNYSKNIFNYTSEKLKSNIESIQELVLVFGGFLFISVVASGKEILSFLWNGKNFTLEDLDTAYLIFMSFGFVLSFQLFFSINRKFAIISGFSRINYNLLSYSQLISAITFFILVYNFNFIGLLLSILLTRGFSILASFFVNFHFGNKNFQPPKNRFWFSYLIMLILIFLITLFFKRIFQFEDIGLYRWKDLAFSFYWFLYSVLIYSIFILFFFKTLYRKLKEITGPSRIDKLYS